MQRVRRTRNSWRSLPKAVPRSGLWMLPRLCKSRELVLQVASVFVDFRDYADTFFQRLMDILCQTLYCRGTRNLLATAFLYGSCYCRCMELKFFLINFNRGRFIKNYSSVVGWRCHSFCSPPLCGCVSLVLVEAPHILQGEMFAAGHGSARLFEKRDVLA